MSRTDVASRETGLRGLTAAEAAARLSRDGPNVLPPPRAVPVWRRLVAQLAHFFALMLWIAGALAFVAGLPELGVAIFVIIVLNAGFAFAQEYRAERAAERLHDLLPRRVTVVREGAHVEVDAAAVVRGDIVFLGGGDSVPADLRVEQAFAAMADTSTLTGESVPVAVGPGERLFAGTFLVEGEALAIVLETGAATRLAGIAAITRATQRPRAPLTVELHRVVRTVAFVAAGVGAVFFGVSLLLGTDPSEGFVFAIGVTVALVPEGLLPTVTLSLAMGAQRMARRNALVRRLEAVETLGSTTFICTDKTGTLTMNQMTVVEVWTPRGRAVVSGAGYEPEGEVHVDPDAADLVGRLALAGARCSTGHVVLRDGEWVPQGDPMEAALDTFARRAGVDATTDATDRPELRRFPFDPRRRRMALVAGDDVLVKGAPDAVLPLCRVGADAEAALEAMAVRGLRVLAIAARSVGGAGPPRSAGEAERDLELLGLAGFEDPPRPHAAASIAACRRAGISVAMVTGDHPATAAAIAREVGLVREGAPVLTGRDLPADDVELGEVLDVDGVVVARVEPEQKLRIARALQARGHVVAMTGDGVNDGPALQEADIGIAMGRTGTDVAREAADLVLLDDDFATIVMAVEEGRAIFANVQRFLTYHLTDNVAEVTPFLVWALSGGRFPLALGVLQILALDIGTDTLSAVALGAEPPGPRLLARPPIRGRLLDRRVGKRVFGVLGPTEGLVTIGAFLVSMLASGWRPGDSFPGGATLATASGTAFAAVVVAQTANAFACRSAIRPPWSVGWLSNRLLVGAAAIELGITALFLFVAPVADALEHAVPSVWGWIAALSAAPLVLLADALQKRHALRSFGTP